MKTKLLSAASKFMSRDQGADWHDKVTIANIQETPYMLTDLNNVRQKCLIFKKSFPDVQLFYAIKAFSDDEVIRAVDPLVDGYDAASLAEIRQLIRLGVDPKRIAFSNPVKPEIHIEEAAKLGVEKFALQSDDEVEKIARKAQGASVYVRVKMDDAHSTVPLSVKFGCSPDIAISLLKKAKRLGLKPVGINFHIGSQQTGFVAWGKAIEKSQDLIDEAQAEGIDATMINVGGGFPARYMPDDPGIDAVAKAINPSLNRRIAHDITYMAEPGRFIVAESSAIVGSVISIEQRAGKCWVYLDVGLFQAFLGAQRFDPFPYPPVSLRHLAQKKSGSRSKKYVITGPSCDSHDIICEDASLPADLKVGDRLLFPNSGAYTIVYGSEFNGFPIPRRYFIGVE